MVNHPARSQKSPEAAIRRLITKHDLKGVSVHFSKGKVIATALPHVWHPIVLGRRADAIATLGPEPTLAALSALGKFDHEIARRSGDTMDQAVTGLSEALDNLAPPPQD